VRGAVLLLAVAALLAGCGGGDALEPGPDAAVPACSGVEQRLPQEVLGASRGTTDVRGAAVWGDPAVVLRCGVTAPGPTTDRCLTVDDVDWIFTEDDDAYRFVTFGRTPAVEVTVPTRIDRTEAPGALTDFTKTVAPLPRSGRKCLDVTEVP
jgi:hypothetical protein